MRPKGDLAFVALDDEHSKRYVPRLLELGYRVIDKSNTYRADPQVPLVTAGVNQRRVDESVRLVANPNCTTIPLDARAPAAARAVRPRAGHRQHLPGCQRRGHRRARQLPRREPGRLRDPRPPRRSLRARRLRRQHRAAQRRHRRQRLLRRRAQADVREPRRSSSCPTSPSAPSAAASPSPSATTRTPGSPSTAGRWSWSRLPRCGQGAPFVRFLPGAAGEGLSSRRVHARPRPRAGRPAPPRSARHAAAGRCA